MSEPLTEDQAAEVAARHGLDPELGRELLAGHDKARAEAFAAATAATREPVQPSDPMAMLAEQSRRKDTALLAALGIHAEEPESEEPDEDSPPDFDGGARTPAPPVSDPEEGFNETMREVLNAKRNAPRDTFYEDGD